MRRSRALFVRGRIAEPVPAPLCSSHNDLAVDSREHATKHTRAVSCTRIHPEERVVREFACPVCRSEVYFESVRCLGCGRNLAFDDASLTIVAMEAAAQGPRHRRHCGSASLELRYCANERHGVCNWLAQSADCDALCFACGLNRHIPDLAEPGSLLAWGDLERAKRRLLYALRRFGLPIDGSLTGARLTFDFVRNAKTGHADGIITVDLKEADAVERERQRQMLQEPYRTLLGHLRHECGHYVWPALKAHGDLLDAFRATFGDERADYAQALERHHAVGPPQDWSQHFVSAYASAHPWEDWAETWAHYLHMVDVLDTAEAVGIKAPAVVGAPPLGQGDPYREQAFELLIGRWIPLTLALNSLSRSMGHADFYPFVISDMTRRKLAFVHQVIHGRWAAAHAR
jgi:hypothetical protein